MTINVSEHISLREATHSDKAEKLGLDNSPNAEQLNNMVLVATMCFEPLRLWYGKPIKINSFFRSEAVNKAVNGSPTSDHCKGHAIDLSVSKSENKKLFEYAKENLQFDQLIWENGDESGPDWVHISYRRNGNRNQVLNLKQKVA
jgi:zinc D-Ala-D-Ala carboxypeptidase